MTDERLCKCGHVLSTHDRDTPSGPMCGMCKCALFEANPSTGERQAEHDPDMNEWMNAPLGAAPSTDEGDEQWAREIADRWVNSATAEDRETVVLTECEKHPGVMPEWACPTCVRASLEAEVERLQGALRPLVAAYDGGDLECPHFHSCPAHRDRVRNGGPCNCGAGEIEAAIENARALATPPSSTEGTE